MRKNSTIGRLFIIVFAVFLILPLSVAMVFFLFTTYDSTEKNISKEVETITHSASSKINTSLENPARYITTLAELASKGMGQKEIEELMDSGIRNFHMFDTLYMLDSEKKVKIVDFGVFRRFSKQDFINIKLGDLGDKHRGPLFWSKPFLSPISNGYVVRVSARYDNGYFVGDINLKFLGDALSHAKKSKSAKVFIVDSSGGVISSDHALINLSHENYINHPMVVNGFMGNRVLIDYYYKNKRYVGSVYRIPVADWYLVYEEEHKAAFKFFYDMLYVVVITFGAIFAFIALILFFMDKKLIRPIKLLTERSEQISMGYFPDFSEEEKGVFQELKTLYDSFEKMSLTIDKREKELKDKEEYLRSIFDSTTNTGILVLSLDDEPIIADANMGAQIIFGYRLSEILGLPVEALVKNLGEDLSRMQGECIKRQSLVSANVEMTKKNGTNFPVLASVQPLNNASGEIESVIAVLIDISEITHVQSELEREKERLDVTLKSIGEGVIAADRFGKVTLINSSAEDILGYKYRYAFGVDIKDILQIYDYETGVLLSEKISDFTSMSNKTYRANIITRDSGVVTVFITSSAIMNHKGELLGSVYVFRDITERIRMEQELINRKKQLEEVNKSLENRIVEETDKRRKNEQMLFEQAKFAAMGQMISAIAHQWRQPLNALALYVQDVEDAYDIGEVDGTYLESFTDNAMRLINHMSGTIDDFRNFFHSSNMLEKIDISQVVFESLALVATQLKNQMINYKVTIASKGTDDVFVNDIPEYYETDTDKKVAIYPSELKQVLLNIIQNARDAIIYCRRDTGRKIGNIEIIVDYKSDRLKIDIVNDGGNIPAETLTNIFDPYFTTKPEGEGTGIGLYMSKIMVEDHMGGLLIAENISGGAKFSITLDYVD